jgi:hypothetical protein
MTQQATTPTESPTLCPTSGNAAITSGMATATQADNTSRSDCTGAPDVAGNAVIFAPTTQSTTGIRFNDALPV